jgi:hypothetical protein
LEEEAKILHQKTQIKMTGNPPKAKATTKTPKIRGIEPYHMDYSIPF